MGEVDEPASPSVRRTGGLRLVDLAAIDNDTAATLARLHLHVPAGHVIGVSAVDERQQRLLVDVVMGRTAPVRGRVLVDGRATGRGPNAVAELSPVDAPPHRRVRDAATAEGAVLDEVAVRRALSAVGLSSVQHLAVAALGQSGRRLLGIAVAMTRGARVLVAVEPTRGLDGARRDDVMAALGEACRTSGLAALVLSGAVPVLARCDEAFVLDRRLRPIRALQR